MEISLSQFMILKQYLDHSPQYLKYTSVKANQFTKSLVIVWDTEFIAFIFTESQPIYLGALSIKRPDWSEPNFCLNINGKIWSMFFKYLAKMDLVLILSKFSGQIGPKPKRFVFHSII
jgi:hypothetical protein